MKPKYYLYAVIDSEPVLLEFTSKAKRKKYISEFESDDFNGTWLDFEIDGVVNNVNLALNHIKVK